jgi:hypothetical protein
MIVGDQDSKRCHKYLPLLLPGEYNPTKSSR